ncbi:MAG: class II aldolase/adducin family protein [Erysipelotrichaceae bacterium]|nr:class II aldolase/adducin family protein [Erysipelotrichaceae bacterium]
MFEKEKAEVLKNALRLDRYGLVALSGGNICWRMETGEILITPSGMIYEDMVPEDILVVDIFGNVIEGTRKPSIDTGALCYILEKRPDLNCVIHTHQPYATGVGLILDELPCNLTTLANATWGSVKVAPYSSAASIQMGYEAVENLGDSLAVILKHHGVIGVGRTLKEAMYSVVYLEEAAKTYYIAYSMSPNVPGFTQTQIDRAVEVFKYYGQNTQQIPLEVFMNKENH